MEMMSWNYRSITNGLFTWCLRGERKVSFFARGADSKQVVLARTACRIPIVIPLVQICGYVQSQTKTLSPLSLFVATSSSNVDENTPSLAALITPYSIHQHTSTMTNPYSTLNSNAIYQGAKSRSGKLLR